MKKTYRVVNIYLLVGQMKKLQKVRFFNGSIGVLWFVIKEHEI